MPYTVNKSNFLQKKFSSYWIRSAFYTFLQRFSYTIFGLVNFILIIRSLPPAQMGVWALFLAVTSIFEATKSGLLKNAHIKYVSGSDDKTEQISIASSSFIINSAISFIFIIILLLFSPWVSRLLHSGGDLAMMLKWFIPGLIFMVFFSHLEAIQQSFLDFKGVFAGYIARQLTFFIAILLHFLLKIPLTLRSLTIYYCISIFVGSVVLYLFSRKYIHHQFKATKATIKKIIAFGSYIFGANIMANLFSNLDQLMTGTFRSSAAVAYYTAASRINGFVDIPSYAAAEILFPKSSRAAVEEGHGKVRYLYERMVGILISITTPAALFMILFPGFVITLVAGARYQAAAPILQLYMVTGLIRPIQNQAANILNSIGKPGLCFAINAFSLVGNLIINYICISSMGFYGAAVGTLITCILGSITWYIIMKKQIGINMGNILRYMAGFYKSAYYFVANLLLKSKKNEYPS